MSGQPSVRAITGLDVAGLRIGVGRLSPADLELVQRLIGRKQTTGPVDASLAMDDVGPPVPVREPDFVGAYGQHWEDEDTHYFRHGWGFTAAVTRTGAYLGGPVTGYERWVTVRNSMLFVLAKLLLSQGRFLLHGAAVRRGERAALIVGDSGAGKSSLAFAAHRAGWQLMADDMVAVHRDGDVLVAQGIPRVPSLPGDVAERHGVPGEELPADARARRELTSLRLDARPAPLALVVVSGHDHGPGRLWRLSPADAIPPLVSALVFSRLQQPVTAWFPLAARLARGPCLRLLHAADPDTRVGRAAALLDEAWVDAERAAAASAAETDAMPS